MTVSPDPARRSIADALAGIALLAGIPALLVFKSVHAGWYLVILIWLGGAFLVVAWVLAWVIAFQTYFARRNAFAATGAIARMRVAAWLHAGSLALAGLIAPDGGDDAPYPSVLGALLGLPMDLQQDLVLIAYLALLAGALAFGWIVVEWITALVIRSRRSRAAPGGVPVELAADPARAPARPTLPRLLPPLPALGELDPHVGRRVHHLARDLRPLARARRRPRAVAGLLGDTS